jgi:hypothetical protein
MRPFLAMLLATGSIMFCTNPLEAQLDPCDDCLYHFEEGNDFAYCLLGGGGLLFNCYQEHQHFCSFDGLCSPEEEDQVPELALAGGVVGSRSFMA